MILLTVSRLRKYFALEPVLDGVSFDVRRGERISLVGPNGTGKTTLLHILAGRLEPDAGTVELPGFARLGLLEQHPEFAPGRTVWDEAREALGEQVRLAEEAERVAAALATADAGRRSELERRFDELQHELERRDAYHLDHKIERVLHGLGFPNTSFRQPVAQLSGGQQNRLLLARLLLAQPDVLLLDEPSNHLDIEATEWLEDFLVQSQATLIVVSHDRYFLDKVATRTLELLHGTVDSYAGNYTAYCRQKDERLEVQRRTYERQQAEIARLQDFVRRNAYGQKHAQAEDRKRKLERIEAVERPREIPTPPMKFPPAPHSGEIVLRAEGIAKAFAQPLFAQLSFDILRGQKWGILGPNGCGKTTLLRCLLGDEPVDQGRIVLGTGVKVAYFDQQLACLPADAEAVDAVRPDHKEFVEQQRRDLLARFGLVGDMVFQRVGSLSGGERNRAALARLAASDANLLILDEPTNHLDLWARAALERALREFDGTILFVSHDRYFLNQVADHLLVVEPGRFRVIDGNYQTYLHLVRQGLAENAVSAARSAAKPAQPGPDAESTAASNRRASPAAQPRRKRRFPYRKVSDLEADIGACESRIAQLHELLASPELLRNGERVRQTMADLEAAQQQLATLYEHWEEASELN
ncbi:MAG: ABC-F family ATP-binding cassette domain-containing protein [Pirellulaceae bacterium]|nr:ABC-F family ATP-binding cassette domain-containing protein [Pirellulaceae bacterium]